MALGMKRKALTGDGVAKDQMAGAQQLVGKTQSIGKGFGFLGEILRVA